MRFEWDERKNRANQRKHGVSFDDASEVFGDPLHLSWLDERFSAFEERWVTIGQTNTGLTLTVANLFFDENGEAVVRLISAAKRPRGRSGNMKNRSDWENYELPDEYDFSGKEAVRGRFYSPKKKSVTIRLDDDVVVYFRKLAGIRKVGYQSLINAALRERMNQTR